MIPRCAVLCCGCGCAVLCCAVRCCVLFCGYGYAVLWCCGVCMYECVVFWLMSQILLDADAIVSVRERDGHTALTLANSGRMRDLLTAHIQKIEAQNTAAPQPKSK